MRPLRAGAFGVAQAVMPLFGYALGAQLARYILSVDRWVAFGLLGAFGVTVLRQAWVGGGDEDRPVETSAQQLLVLWVATSIDALVAGIGFGFLDVDPLVAVTPIGVTTFALTLLGVVVGQRAGASFAARASETGSGPGGAPAVR